MSSTGTHDLGVSALAKPLDAGYEALAATGAVVRLRPVQLADAEGLRELYARTSDDSIRLRFFSVSKRAVEQEIARLLAPSRPGYLSLVALIGDKLVGVASYVGPTDGSAVAEVALLVDDAHHGEGVGTLLLEHLASRAQREGIEEFVAETLQHNHAMLTVFQRSGFEQATEYDSGVVTVRLDTAPAGETLAAIDARERAAEVASLTPLFAPRSVAVVGAGAKPEGVGHQVVRSLLRGGFTGPLYPVNLRATDVAGLRAYSSVAAIGQIVDLAVIAVPSSAVDDVIEDCGRNAVRSVVVITSYPPRTGDTDQGTRESLLRTARRWGMRVVGPNCLGLVNTDPAVRLDASFARTTPAPGGIALASQSGAVGIAALDHMTRSGVGVASFVSLGDKVDISGNDLLHYWDRDSRVDVIALYLESVGNPRKFARLARGVSRHKPVVLLKAGRSESGRRAGLSHTAAAATNDVMVDVLSRQAGIIRVETLEGLVEVSTLFARQPLPAGGRVGIVGNAGGAGVLAADAAQRAGLDVPEFSDGLQDALTRIVLDAAVTNPVDLGAAANAETLGAAITMAAGSGEIDAIIAIFAATAVGEPDEIVTTLSGAAETAPVPVLGVILGMDLRAVAPRDDLRRQLPVFAFPEPAVRALEHAVHYARWRNAPAGRLLVTDPEAVGRADHVVAGYLGANPSGGWTDVPTARDLLACYAVDVVETVTAVSSDDAVATCERIGYPVVLKTGDPNVVHKSEAGGVHVGLVDAAAVADAYASITAATGSAEVIVQPMIRVAGTEMAIGVSTDPSFGPIVMVGLGGVATDVLDDRTFAAAPVTDAEARRMVLGLRAARLLTGYRGAPAAPIDDIVTLLQGVGQLAAHHAEVVELDLNPVVLGPDGLLAVDVRLRLAPVADRPDLDLRRLRS